ncbi:molybdopterin molybdenumtransferase MoeA, partial [Paenibacillus validus]|nr:molybdopterin molybdenumtransferase MoeA [Paenibacillus validus]MED4609511.1 molybdopterin molybdenumtransferase MoeA [Paenibacillus validus]
MPNLSGKYNRDTVQVEEALNRIQAHVRVLETETVPLAQASGRRVAARIAAPHPYPAFRRSGMDGYA